MPDANKEIDNVVNNAIDILSSTICEKHRKEVDKQSFSEFCADKRFKGCVACYQEDMETVLLALDALKRMLQAGYKTEDIISFIDYTKRKLITPTNV